MGPWGNDQDTADRRPGLTADVLAATADIEQIFGSRLDQSGVKVRGGVVWPLRSRTLGEAWPPGHWVAALEKNFRIFRGARVIVASAARLQPCSISRRISFAVPGARGPVMPYPGHCPTGVLPWHATQRVVCARMQVPSAAAAL